MENDFEERLRELVLLFRDDAGRSD